MSAPRAAGAAALAAWYLDLDWKNADFDFWIGFEWKIDLRAVDFDFVIDFDYR